MMHQLRPFAKKFLLAYAVSVVMVLIYLVIKSLFPNMKEIELKSFDKPTEVLTQPLQQEIEDTQESKGQNSKKSFTLLPRK